MAAPPMEEANFIVSFGLMATSLVQGTIKAKTMKEKPPQPEKPPEFLQKLGDGFFAKAKLEEEQATRMKKELRGLFPPPAAAPMLLGAAGALGKGLKEGKIPEKTGNKVFVGVLVIALIMNAITEVDESKVTDLPKYDTEFACAVATKAGLDKDFVEIVAKFVHIKLQALKSLVALDKM